MICFIVFESAWTRASLVLPHKLPPQAHVARPCTRVSDINFACIEHIPGHLPTHWVRYKPGYFATLPERMGGARPRGNCLLSGRRYEGEGALDAVFEAVWNFCVFLSLCDAMERESAESE